MRRPSNLAMRLVCCASFAVLASSCSRDPQKLKQEYLASGDKYVAEKKYSEAVIQYRNALSIDPKQGDTRLKLGKAYAANNDSVNALREYIRAADLLPQNIDAQLAAGTGLLAARQYGDSKTRALAVLEKEPKNVAALLLLGNSLAGLKDIEGAIAQVEEAIDSDPQRVLSYANLGQLAYSKGDTAAAEAAFKNAVEVAPKSVEAHLALANFYWATRAPADAERELKAALEIDPKSSGANRALAVFYTQSGRVDESEPYLRAWADEAQDAGPKLVLADFLVAKRRVPDAKTLLQSLLGTPDGFAPAQRRLASLDFVSGRRKEAYDALDKILSRQPKDENTLLQKARFLLVDNDAKGALAQADIVAKDYPRSAAAPYLRGIALKALGDTSQSKAAFLDALKLAPNAAPTLLQLADLTLAEGDTKTTLQYADQVIKQQPAQGTAHLIRARALLKDKNYQALDPELQGLLKGSPNSAEVQTLAGDYYRARHDAARARTAYDRAIAVNAAYLPALSGLVIADIDARKPDAARTRVEAQLAKTPNNEQLLLLAGKMYVTISDPKRAEETFRRVIEVNPASIQGYRTLATLYFRQRRLDEAKQYYEEAAKRDPKNAVYATTMVGMILGAQGKADEARAQYQRAIELDPTAAVAANNLAWDYAQNNRDLDVALKLAQTAKSQLPDNADVNDTLGWVYYKKDLASLAVQSLQTASKQAPDNPGTHYRLGLAYAKNGDHVKARQSLETALKLNPGFDGAADAKKQIEALRQ